MSLIGSRLVLVANLCGLAIALATSVVGAYIVHGCFGYYRPQDVPAFFAPAAVMFIVRNRIFSLCFLVLYVALLLQMSFQASIVGVDREACGGRDDPLGYMVVFFVISVICLALYPLVVLARFILSVVASRK